MKACVFTLGCKQNEVESASVMRGLRALGYEVTDTLSAADLYLLNTCAVTAEAEKKSRQAVARMRKYNPDAPVVVFGCAAQHSAEAFAKKEGVVLVTGAMQKAKLLELIGPPGLDLKGSAPRVDVEEERDFCELPRPLRTKTRAFLRVQDGCNRFCSYCLIPYLRGRSRCRPLASVLGEAQACDAKEIVLTGIDLSAWREGESDLGDLLLALKDVPARIRLGSLEAGVVTERFLEKMARAQNVMPHFHLSLQSGSTRVLRAMNRHYTREEYLALCGKIYEVFPDAAITTDIIAGFPTETDEDFEASLSIIDEAGFSRVHVFPFSARAGTGAAKLPDLPASVKEERTKRLIERGEAAAKRYLEKRIGRRYTALFENGGGYTENYIRVYNEMAEEGGMYEVTLLELYQDGMKCQIERRLE